MMHKEKKKQVPTDKKNGLFIYSKFFLNRVLLQIISTLLVLMFIAKIWTDASFDAKWQIASFATLIILYRNKKESDRRLFTRVVRSVPTSTEAEYSATIFATECIRILKDIIGGRFECIDHVYVYNDCTRSLRRFSTNVSNITSELKQRLRVKTLSFGHCSREEHYMKLVDSKARSNLRHFRLHTSWKTLPFRFKFQPKIQ